MAKRSEIAKDILYVLSKVGILAVVIVAPGMAEIFRQYDLYKKYSKTQIDRSFKGLENSRMVSIGQEGDKTVIKLTKKGKEKWLKFKIDDMKIKPQKKWDRKWRLVTYDIPVEFNNNRKEFTRKLGEIGFELVQKSLWACPYPCEDEVDFLKEIYEIRPFVRLITAEEIDIKADLIKRFKLG
ncbi:MAG: hypothetical protein A3I07_03145 [Candidatus Doudnabacteria bacterium RIFCSPLOWO2_02_FULL_42_9]|uniref:Transcriptional repressor PaaX-like central Cas2-like domain-containing protein n=1 Tax=Candidatus Doudnabacteria bacterium RIFCSPHIGHO2_01_FULL_41_86 TaxID=1817821 RepID=A0A1F5N9F2_9BACT|nr:MAG: hypothetical protein A2717_01465 [Candidatus Doudnabacteria bacterium RIFCSPHIGHO2_01_FULL_41_86]OGE75056.1 MAG: hypothetical protein A3K07_04785 [Candidatus Doudnabacteria bacterium RIFCSPHIGHO2_01_43_10]OGE85237.1 MAG: hypothetical protein A3E28_01035 [Candidatus Doudnabacteria bacterium RIFCSPHIGHO2_12_FULL_42_22]OGE86775.1 MAG: hypothetical protein A3C49_01870 [Candidatus Doudnabacteria bacterium RIFCSPHIGHO2_02_FULL_42_25]OGE92373.1 MAG: hypothetical protein A2895_02025 [Candidatus